jgi:hypothetical protein
MINTLSYLLNIAYVVNDPALQAVSAVATDTLLHVMRGVAHVASNPTVVLYTLQAAIYAVAAFLSRHAGHKELSACYAGSSCIHALLGACHVLHLE